MLCLLMYEFPVNNRILSFELAIKYAVTVVISLTVKHEKLIEQSYKLLNICDLIYIYGKLVLNSLLYHSENKKLSHPIIGQEGIEVSAGIIILYIDYVLVFYAASNIVLLFDFF